MDIENLKSRYRGSVAEEYDSRRTGTDKWEREQNAVAEYLDRIVDGRSDLTVLDVPVGTGRFMDLYREYSLAVVGVDVSPDMLDRAREKLADDDGRVTFLVGDVMDLDDVDVDPDVVVCIRFLNWLTLGDVRRALSNVVSKSPSHLVVGVRLRTSTRHRVLGPLRRLYHAVRGTTESKTRIHDERSVLRAFSALGLSVEGRTLVDTWLFGDKYIYWLSLDDGPGS